MKEERKEERKILDERARGKKKKKKNAENKALFVSPFSLSLPPPPSFPFSSLLVALLDVQNLDPQLERCPRRDLPKALVPVPLLRGHQRRPDPPDPHPQNSRRQRRGRLGPAGAGEEPPAAALPGSLGRQGLDRPPGDESVWLGDRAVGPEEPGRARRRDVEASVEHVEVDSDGVARRDRRGRACFSSSHLVDAEAALFGVGIVGFGDLALLQLLLEAMCLVGREKERRERRG